MRVVLDTNVLISALFFAGLPGRILAAWIDERFEVLASVPQPLLDLVIRDCHLVEPTMVPPSACEDPDDLSF